MGFHKSYLLIKGENIMTRLLTTLDIPTLHTTLNRHAIGFDRMFDELNRTFIASRTDGNYPPYNIIRVDDTNYEIELAVAGFAQDEIDVEFKDTQLTIKGEQQSADQDEAVEYLHKGISARAFVRTFTLAEHVEVRDASVANGILTISLEHVVPDAKKPKKIQIEYKG